MLVLPMAASSTYLHMIVSKKLPGRKMTVGQQTQRIDDLLRAKTCCGCKISPVTIGLLL